MTVATAFYIIYHSLILIALILAFVSYKKGVSKVLFLALVLLATFIVEGLTGYFKFNGIKGKIWIYHIFNLFEYSFFCMYYIQNCQVEKYKKIVVWSIPVFIFFGLGVSTFLYHFTSMPALNINVEGFLLLIGYTHLLFNIDVDLRMYIYTHPDFWIATGVLVFNAGAFVYLSSYRSLLHLDRNQTAQLFGPIMDSLNIIMYNCFIIGLICLIRNRKYLAR